MASVQLSASVEIISVSRLRDFIYVFTLHTKPRVSSFIPESYKSQIDSKFIESNITCKPTGVSSLELSVSCMRQFIFKKKKIFNELLLFLPATLESDMVLSRMVDFVLYISLMNRVLMALKKNIPLFFGTHLTQTQEWLKLLLFQEVMNTSFLSQLTFQN